MAEPTSEIDVTHEQTEALFDLDQPPPIRKGAANYLAHLGGLLYQHDRQFYRALVNVATGAILRRSRRFEPPQDQVRKVTT